jgi:hypothetical protein
VDIVVTIFQASFGQQRKLSAGNLQMALP